VNEIKAIGRVDSTVRTDEQTQVARLWAAVDVADYIVSRFLRPLEDRDERRGEDRDENERD
jgi:hypothetical protein